MSHIVQAALKLTERKHLLAAIEQLGLKNLGEARHKLYSGNYVQGLGIQFKGWNHPVVIDSEGTAHYDNFGGTWGNQDNLDELCQRYALIGAEETAAIEGYIYNQTTLENGDVEVEMVKLLTS